MKERYCSTYLPRSKVTRVFVSSLLPTNIINELKAMMIKPYVLGKSNNLHSELAYHPDIIVNNVRQGLWICERNASYIPKGIPQKLFLESETELSDLYPYDCPFNNFRLGHALVCGKNADYLIKAYAEYEDILTIYVAQNYTKCCTILVNDRAAITNDYYIAKTMRKHGFDVLNIEDSSDIGLNGYSHGLIGGCCGNIDPKTIVFTGNLNKYKKGNDIKDFCANYNIDVISLTNDYMYDYGGILPITEISDDSTDDVSEHFDINI